MFLRILSGLSSIFGRAAVLIALACGSVWLTPLDSFTYWFILRWWYFVATGFAARFILRPMFPFTQTMRDEEAWTNRQSDWSSLQWQTMKDGSHISGRLGKPGVEFAGRFRSKSKNSRTGTTWFDCGNALDASERIIFPMITWQKKRQEISDRCQESKGFNNEPDSDSVFCLWMPCLTV